MSAKTKKIVQSVLLSWFVITSIIPTIYLSGIPLAKAAAIDCIVTNTNDTGPGSLRACINSVNLNTGHDSIYFSTTGTINMAAPALTLSDTAGVTISGSGSIELDGIGMSGLGSEYILSIQSSYNYIKGLKLDNAQGSAILIGTNATYNSIGGSGSEQVIITNSTQSGIYVDDGSTNTIQGTYIGTDGSTAYANADGITIALESGDSVTVGGTGSGSGCVISGNTDNGIQFNSGNAGTVSIINNTIGLTSDGTTTLANGGDGIEISSSSGTTTIQRNTISGNSVDGVSIASNSGTISMDTNKIGTNSAGTSGKANGNYGIDINASSGGSITIGASGASRNLISGNGKSGVYVTGSITSSTITISGNYIGMNTTGTAALANIENGIDIESTLGSGGSVIIGSSSSSTVTNIISGNTQNGILAAQSCSIYSSYIGLNAAATGNIANALNGVSVTGNSVTIGNGSLTTGFNVISGNTKSGISVSGSASSTTITGNYIGTNIDGTSSTANTENGIVVTTTGSITIGSSSSASLTNVISGNSQYGINVNGPSSFSLYSSAVGTNAGGTGSMGNSSGGIVLSTTATSFTIGNGSLTTGYNVISGNSGTGLLVSGLSAGAGTINGNFIGMDKNGASKVANQVGGIEIKNSTGATVTIGSSSSSTATNVISGNGGVGIGINNTNSVAVYSSIIGADLTETSATTIGNGGHGISAYNSSSLTIGNTRSSGWNLMANNAGAGILINGGTSSTIKGNFISTDRALSYDLGNTGAGIQMASTSGNTIGGTGSTDGNLIKNSDSYGINISGSAADLIRGNLIYQNGTPATPIYISTPGTWDVSGAAFTTATTSKVAGTLTGFADGTTIDVYSGNDAATPSLMRYEGSTTLSSNAFALNMDFQTTAGTYFYITAVDTSTKKTSQASGASGAVTADSTAPADLTVTSSTATNNSSYTFTGTKEAYASVESDGTTWVEKSDSGATWTHSVTLSAGANTYNLCSEDYSYNRSGTGTYVITLDTSAPSAPTLSYTTPIATSTASIQVSGETGANIFINSIDSGKSITVSGTQDITVSLTANTTNTFSITLKDTATNESAATIATIVAGDTTTYGGGGGGGSSSDSSNNESNSTQTTTETSDNTDTTTTTTTTTEEPSGTSELAGEDESGTTENFDEQLPEPPTATETTDQEKPKEAGIKGDTIKPKENKPVIQTQVTEEKIDEKTVLITYKEPVNASEGNSTIGAKAKVMEVTLNTGNKPKGKKGLNIKSILAKDTSIEIEETEEVAPTQEEQEATLNTFVDEVSKLVTEEKDIDIKVENVIEQVFEDDDNDGMPNVWEDQYLGDEEISSTADTDNDGLTNAEEYLYGSDPANNDTDGDGLSDGIEVLGLGTDPNTWDTDGDGISDTKEIFYGTSATEKTESTETIDTAIYSEYADSDSDGLSDYVEAELGTDPTNTDSDNDGLTDAQELEYDTNPNSADTNIVYGNPKRTKATNIKDGDILSTSKTLLKGTSTPNTKVLITILDANKKPISVLEAEVDANGKFAVTMDEGLADGTYSMFIIGTDEKGKNAKDISPISTFTVDSTKAVAGITVAEVDDPEYIKDGTTTETSKPKIKAFSAPRSRIYVTWRSFIFTSVLMSDTETGEFVVETPSDLENGDHTAYIYAVDEETGVQGEVMMVNFTISGENLTSETTGIPGGESAKYLYLLILPILGLGAAYIFYKKSKEAKKVEKSLIEKLEHKN